MWLVPTHSTSNSTLRKVPLYTWLIFICEKCYIFHKSSFYLFAIMLSPVHPLQNGTVFASIWKICSIRFFFLSFFFISFILSLSYCRCPEYRGIISTWGITCAASIFHWLKGSSIKLTLKVKNDNHNAKSWEQVKENVNDLFDDYLWCPIHPFSVDLNEGRDVVGNAFTGDYSYIVPELDWWFNKI